MSESWRRTEFPQIVAALAPLSYVLLHPARDLETFWRVGLLIVDASLIALLFIGPGSAWFARPQRS